MTTPPASWYPDPTGRHAARYWDGFTWTAHVADGTEVGVEPLPPTPTATSTQGSTALHVPARAVPREPAPIGPGTAQLRAMAAARAQQAAAAPPSVPHEPDGRERRGGRAGFELGLILTMVVAVLVGGAVLWRATRDSGSDHERGAATWKGDGYRFELPPSWIEADLPAGATSLVDGAFRVADPGNAVVLVGDQPMTRAQLPDAERLRQFMTADLQAGSAINGLETQVISTDVVETADRLIGLLEADVSAPDGTLLLTTVYLVVEDDASLVLMVLGDRGAVQRQQDEALAIATSVTFTR